MSTRAMVIIKSQSSSLMFYRHSDGYPKGVAPTLNTFMSYLHNHLIRDNTGQAAGWLILLGSDEYCTALPPSGTPENEGMGWKVGAYEPSAVMHVDIDYIYEIDLTAKTLKGWKWNWEKESKGRRVSIPKTLTIKRTKLE